MQFNSKKDKVILILGEYFDRFNFYGVQALLVLYFINILHLNKYDALITYGAYSSLGFVLPLVGGYLSDKFFINKFIFVLAGIAFIITGDLILIFAAHNLVFLGLTILTSGIGLFKANNLALFSNLYQDYPEKKSVGLTYYYAAMNAGAITGPILYGSIDLFLGWKHGLTLSALGFSLSFILCLWRYRYYQPNLSQAKNNNFDLIKLSLSCFIAFICIYLCLRYNTCLKLAIAGSCVVVASFLFTTVIKLSGEARQKMILLIVVIAYSVFYYASSLQVSSSLMLYLNSSVNTKIFNLTIPYSYFMSVSPLAIIVFAHLVAKLQHHKSKNDYNFLLNQVSLSIYLAALSFSLFALSSLFSKEIINWQLILILFGLVTLGLGELVIFPAITSAITSMVPVNKHSTFIGIMYLFIGYSAYLAALLANILSSKHNLFSYSNLYFQNFSTMALITLIIAMSISFIKKFCSK